MFAAEVGDAALSDRLLFRPKIYGETGNRSWLAFTCTVMFCAIPGWKTSSRIEAKRQSFFVAIAIRFTGY
jgi:hypothetical protein